MNMTERTLNLRQLRQQIGMDTSVVPAASSLRPTPAVASVAYLVWISPSGPSLGRRFEVQGEPIVIGREATSTIVVNENSVSRSHAQVTRLADGTYRVEDLHSTNGTFVNDAPITTSLLADGDYLRCGSCIYRFLASGNVEADYHEELHRLSVIDPLTGLHNRRYLNEWLYRELDRCATGTRPLSVLLLDIDHFKNVNDRFGHLAGDATLRGLAEQLVSHTRKDELLARYGGEEFALVMPETDLERGVACGERLRRAVAETPFELDGQAYPLTVSIGVGTIAAGTRVTPEELLKLADGRLYEAKRTGRNRVAPAARIGASGVSFRPQPRSAPATTDAD